MSYFSTSAATDYANDIHTYVALNHRLQRQQRILAQMPLGPQRDALIQTIADLKREVKELNKNLNRITA